MEETSRLLRANLAERLRYAAYTGSEFDATPYTPIVEVMREAADEIERQAARIAALEVERDAQYDENVNRIAAEGEAILRAEAAEAKLAIAVKALNTACNLIDAMMTNDPNEPVSDAGHTALDLWKHEAARLRATLK